MKKPKNSFLKNLRYLCLVGVIALGLMTIVGSGGGGGGGDATTTTPPPTDDGGDTTPTTDGGDTTAETHTTFNISNAVSLLAMEQTVTAASVRKTSSDGRPLFTYEIWNEGLEKPLTKEELAERAKQRSAKQDGEEEAAGTNLLAVDEEGNAWLAIDSDYPIKVMYSVTDPAGEYVYLALDTGWWGDWDGNDYTQYIAQENCAFFRVKIADNTIECVKEEVFVQNMDQYYMQNISGDQKPIQFDENGNVFFTATEFTREEDSWENCWWDPETQQDVCETEYWYWINQTTWNPRIYRMDKDTGVITALTTDIESVEYFLALPSGEVAYQSWNQQTGKSELWMWQADTTAQSRATRATIDLSTDVSWGVDFFAIDTDKAVMWGEWAQNGMSFARPRSQEHGGGVEKAFLNTNLFGGNNWGDSTPRRVIVADDGRLYGVFESYLWDPEANNGQGASYTVLSVYQMLPYDGVPKLELTLSTDWGWWDWMGETPFQVSKGFLYYVENYDPADGYGTCDIIKMVKLEDRTISQLLDTGTGRYEIYKWKLSGDMLHFTALDKSRSIVVTGEVDTLKVKEGLSGDDVYDIQDTASAWGSISAIQDIEVITPQAPEVDTGGTPVVQQWHTAPENLYSVSMDFTKYMDKDSVEQNMTFVDENSNSIDCMSIWIYKSLHLIPDRDNYINPDQPNGLLDSSGTTPLAFNTEYTIRLGNNTMDAYGVYLGDADGNLPKFTSFKTKPQFGWWHSPTDAVNTAISDTGVAKYASSQSEYTFETFDLGLNISAPANIRIEFSGKNYGWEGVNVVLWDKIKWASSSQNWDGIVLRYRLNNWSECEYKTIDEYGYEYNAWIGSDDGTEKIFNGTWLRYRIDIYGSNMKLYYSEDGTTWTEVESLSATDLIGRANSYTCLLRVVEPVAIDNLLVSTLNADGNLPDGGEGNLLDLDFTSNIEVADGDIEGDDMGFDDDLNSDLNFDSWW